MTDGGFDHCLVAVDPFVGILDAEIAKKRGVAVGSVGVYLKRGLEAMRRIWGEREES